MQGNVDYDQNQHQESHNGQTINTKKDNEHPRPGIANWRIHHRTRFCCHHRRAQLAV
ncbi:hypothetical protein ECA2225A [Pectobacterium atrosepticum SCRI1043]|uniref:Uncharacterized protein n=1 Tax=Pectobacterium atrosepticum (strain SCRI 1043 / ATCC BAA-672) TaxID=218491 RepID=Q6D516_PECAS|nr:hypothetical protein ECA2225A [Pectobacterium atrosepticum SCRI1043]